MAINFLSSIDLNKSQLLNAVIQNLASDPAVATSVEGQVYFNTTDTKLRVFASSAWEAVGDITAVTSSTTNQLTVADSTGPAPALSIVTGSIADGGTNLVTSDVIFDYVDGIASGLVDSVTTGNADTITIGGTNADPTVSAKTAAVAASGNSLATGDQINTFVTAFGYTTNVGTVTDVTAGAGIKISGTSTVNPTVSLEYTTADNYIEVNSSATADGEDFIPIADASNAVKKTKLKDVPVLALEAVKTYIDASNLGQSVFQGGYNAATNSPNLDTVTNIAVTRGFFYAVTDTGTFFTETVQPGDLIYADVDQPANNADNVIGKWVVVQSGQDIAGAGANDGATVKGITGFSSDSFAVSANGFTTIKNDGVILGTQTSGAYVEAVTTGTGLDGAVATEGSTAALALDFNALNQSAGELFIMLTDGEKVPKRTTAAEAGAILNSESTFSASIGDASATSFAVTHNLGTTDVIVQLFDVSTKDTVYADTVRTSANVVTIDFNAAPATNDIRVLVQKIG